ncbi:uncharacterized protein LOC133292131 isoform X2 [Gastrolobium bilobum]|nr:uncharacterized protein LOC133292131 isoform X2 [Gastrolobium bilobum]XP_061346493.1 uncharacterized protein LOC133292131 isoform X2 [Gastrolobium bilobum]
MPPPEMKAKPTTTCKSEGNYPHVSLKSNKISKMPCSKVRVDHGTENLAVSSQTSQDGFSKNEDSSTEHDNEKNQTVVAQTCLSFNGCLGSIEEKDSLPFSLSSSSETMLYYFDEPNDALCKQFEAVSREQMTRASLLDYSKFSNFQMPDACEVCLTGFSSNGVPVFDDIFNYNTLYDLGFTGTNLMYDATEGIRLFPTVDATIEATDYHYGGSCEEFPHMSDSSWFHLMCHQAKPFTEELVFNSGQFDSDGVDYSDPEAFVKNFLELSDEFNSLPALVSKETSRMKHITLVLDLDETLVHSSMRQCDNADFTIQMLIEKEHTVYVRQRPFLREFLEKVSEMFEIIIFTASKSVYAEKLLDVLDPDKKLFSRRLYRESCIFLDGTYTKDLTVLGIDLAKVVIIDNTPEVFRLQVDNGIPIQSWFDDPSDSALISLLPFLEKLVDVDDVRPIIAEKFGSRN